MLIQMPHCRGPENLLEVWFSPYYQTPTFVSREIQSQTCLNYEENHAISSFCFADASRRRSPGSPTDDKGADDRPQDPPSLCFSSRAQSRAAPTSQQPISSSAKKAQNKEASPPPSQGSRHLCIDGKSRPLRCLPIERPASWKIPAKPCLINKIEHARPGMISRAAAPLKNLVIDEHAESAMRRYRALACCIHVPLHTISENNH